MEIRQLRYFIAVAEALSFTEAGRQLFVAQSAMSRQIALLENEIGVRLFSRNKRSVKLTMAGEVFLKEAMEAVKKLERAAKRAHEAAGGEVGNVSIAFLSPDSGAHEFMPGVIRKFHDEHPEVEFDLQQHSLRGVMKAVAEGDADLGISLAALCADSPDVAWERICVGKNYIVVSADHALAAQSSVDLAALVDEPFVLMCTHESPEVRQQLMKQFASHGFFPRIVAQAPFVATMLFLVEAGLGVSMAPSFARSYGSEHVRFLDIEGGTDDYEVAMIWRRDNDNPSLALFMKEIRGAVSQSLLE
jgi:DNA-binding transcriptional LysR family regulator